MGNSIKQLKEIIDNVPLRRVSLNEDESLNTIYQKNGSAGILQVVQNAEAEGWEEIEKVAQINIAAPKIISISKKESKHSFPVEHTDMMMQSIFHKVPTDQYDDLAKFDGSVTVDRTQGLISARCDMEANNMLALNLVHDIITGKKTVAKARKT